MRLHVLDGTYELFRSHFGAPPRRAPDGREIGATVGVIQSTLALLDQPEVTHLAVATDSVIESFRNQMFDGYKTSAGIEPELLAQFPLVERALRSMGVVVWGMIDFEADDALATAARRWAGDVDQVVLLSPDKDLSQCVIGRQVVTFRRREGVEIDEKGVVEKFGVRPESIPDYLALVGDAADGVPGLPGWGAKSTAAVLARYRHIEDVPDSAAAWDVQVRGAVRLAETLSVQRDRAMFYRALTILRTDVPLAEELPDLEWRGVPTAGYLDLCDELGLTDLRSRPSRWVDQ